MHYARVKRMCITISALAATKTKLALYGRGSIEQTTDQRLCYVCASVAPVAETRDADNAHEIL